MLWRIQPTEALPRTDAREQCSPGLPSIANLAEGSEDGQITTELKGTAADGYKPAWLHHAVEEPLAEADVEVNRQ